MSVTGVARRARQALSGFAKLAGYATSMVLLAGASLVVIPEMIVVDGKVAWGSIALGQAVGTVSAVIVAYGWQLSGPALVAQGDDSSRRREFEESLVLKVLLFVPAALCSGAVAALFAHQRADLAALGAVSTASFGLTASWFFVGLSQPFRLLVAETVPRVLGTLLGIVLMRQGTGGAFTALVCQLAGMVGGALVSSALILATLSPQIPGVRRRSPRNTLARQANGLGASVTSSAYVSAPLVIVSLVAPAIQPVYALVDKLARQLAVGLTPFVSLLQGWVPRGDAAGRLRRVRQALVVTAAGSVLVSVVVAGLGPFIVRWVGGGFISVGPWMYVLMGLLVGLSLFEVAIAHAVLPTLGRIDIVTKATGFSAVIGMPLTVLGALFSVEFAMTGLLLGLLCRTTIETSVSVRSRLSQP